MAKEERYYPGANVGFKVLSSVPSVIVNNKVVSKEKQPALLSIPKLNDAAQGFTIADLAGMAKAATPSRADEITETVVEKAVLNAVKDPHIALWTRKEWLVRNEGARVGNLDAENVSLKQQLSEALARAEEAEKGGKKK